VYATAAERESWRNFKGGKVGWPTDAAIARHRSVSRKTCSPSSASGRCQFSGQVGSRAEVHLVRGLAEKGWMGHLRVVLFNKELDQDTKPLDRIEGVEKKPLMLHRTPERLNHRVGKANIDLRENSVQAGSEQSGVHRAVDVLNARIDVDERLAGRERAKFYKDRGYDVKFIDLAEKH